MVILAIFGMIASFGLGVLAWRFNTNVQKDLVICMEKGASISTQKGATPKNDSGSLTGAFCKSNACGIASPRCADVLPAV